MSLNQHLNRGLAIILGSVFLAHWLAADWVIRAITEKQMLTRLNHDCDSLLETLNFNASGQLTFDSSHAGAIYRQPFSGHYFVIKTANQTYISASLADQSLSFVDPPKDSSIHFHYTDGPQQQPLLVLSRSIEQMGHQINISVAEDLTDIGQDIDIIRIIYLIISFIVLFIAVVLQRININRALQPLNAISEQLVKIGNGEIQQITAPVPSEIRPLVLELNRLLILVEQRLQKSRTAIGNLTHALKTPLAVLFRLAEHPDIAANPKLQQQFRQQNDAIQQRIDRELKHARISGSIQAGSSFNPHEDLSALSQLLQNIFSEKKLIIDINVPNAPVCFDREDMLELIGNLLDNACKWAKLHIVINIIFNSKLIIQVLDDGPGCSEIEMAQLAQRGLRLDESIQGHGLGLAIVRDITLSYRGTLAITKAVDLGGLCVTVTLPYLQDEET